jgi:hypothetical protein
MIDRKTLEENVIAILYRARRASRRRAFFGGNRSHQDCVRDYIRLVHQGIRMLAEDESHPWELASMDDQPTPYFSHSTYTTVLHARLQARISIVRSRFQYPDQQEWRPGSQTIRGALAYRTPCVQTAMFPRCAALLAPPQIPDHELIATVDRQGRVLPASFAFVEDSLWREIETDLVCAAQIVQARFALRTRPFLVAAAP